MANKQLVVKFNKPYKFEGKEYKEVDLSGLENLTGDDLIDVDQIMAASGGVSLVPELTLSYNVAIASKVAGLPVEFFKSLPAKEALKVKGTVMNFLNN